MGCSGGVNHRSPRGRAGFAHGSTSSLSVSPNASLLKASEGEPPLVTALIRCGENDPWVTLG